MKNLFLALAALSLLVGHSWAAPVKTSELVLTNNPSPVSLVAISALTGASTYESRSQTLSNLVQSTLGITAQFITSSNNIISYANTLGASYGNGLTNTSWHLTNGGVRLIVKSNATEYLSFRGGAVGILTNNPQAALHIYSGGEPGILLESPTDDIAHIRLNVKGVQLFSVDSTGQVGGRLSLYDTNGTPTMLFNPGGQSYINLTNGVSIGTNNAGGYKFYVAGNAFFRDGLYLSGSTTNAGTMRQIGSVTFPNLTTNRVMTLDAGGSVSVISVAATNVASDDIMRGQAVPIAATNTIDWSTNPKQYTTVSNDTAFTFTAGTNYGSLTLTVYNDGTGTRALYWPQVTHNDSGAALPSSLGPTEFLTVVFRKINGNVHAAAITAQGITAQTNAVNSGLGQYLNFVAGSGISITATNATGSATTNSIGISATVSGAGALLTNTVEFGSTTYSNTFYRSYVGASSGNLTNWIFDYNQAEIELPSSVITNGINIVHLTNGPAAGSGTNAFMGVTIDTGNTNRLLSLPSALQGNIYGTNTTTATFLLPSNVVVRIVFQRMRGLISGDFMSYPIWTP